MPAPTVSDNPEVQQHYAAQLTLTALLASQLRNLEDRLVIDPSNLRDAIDKLAHAAGALVNHFSSASISLSADYFETLRAQAGITTPFTTPVVSPMPNDAAAAYLSEAASYVLTAPVGDPVAAVRSQIDAASQSLVMRAGNNELLAAVEADRRNGPRGWARITRPGACSFCRLLATRGAVYHSKQSANFRAHTEYDGKGGVCRCTVEPVFSRHYEPPAHTRADQRAWAEVTKGLSGADARRAWRQYVEGRDVTVIPGGEGKRTKPSRRRVEPVTPVNVDAGRTTEQLKATLAQLEKSLQKFDSPGTRRRVEDLRREIARRSN